MSVFVLTSKTYCPETSTDVVGVFDSWAAADNFQRFADPPVLDAHIDEWGVTSRTEQQRDRHAHTISEVQMLLVAEDGCPTNYPTLLRDAKGILAKFGWIDAPAESVDATGEAR